MQNSSGSTLPKSEPSTAGPLIRWLIAWWKKHPGILSLLLVLTTICTATSLIYPYFFKIVIDGLKTGLPEKDLKNAILIMLVTGTASAILNWVLMSTRAYSNMKIEWDLRDQLFVKVSRGNPSFFHRFRSGDLVTRMSDDIGDKLSWFACSGVFRFIQGILLMGFVIAVMWKLNPVLAMIALSILPIIGFIIRLNHHVYEKRYKQLQERITEGNDFIEACISGIRILRAYGRSTDRLRGFSRVMTGRVNAEMLSARTDASFRTWEDLAVNLTVGAVVMTGASFVISGKLSIGSFFACITYTLMLIRPSWMIGYFFVGGKRAIVSYNRVKEVLDAQELQMDRSSGAAVLFENEIVIQNLTFRYPESAQDQLKKIRFRIQKGQKVAIAGDIASGKSTFLSLLLRFLEPTEGSIEVDGKDIRTFPIHSWRRIIGFAPQEAQLFSDSILSNIMFHREWVEPQHAHHSARIAQLERDLPQFKDGFDTQIGQRGVAISGGQKQRLSLARAIARAPESGIPALLILDDVTSALDPETERGLWDELAHELPHLTSVIVTHRPQVLEKADQVVVLKDGEMVAVGRHQDLIREIPYYRMLCEKAELD